MRTYIFGGGASKAENVPVTSEILPKAFSTLLENDHVRRTKEFLRDIFYLDLNDHQFYPSFEDVLNIVDASIIQNIDISSKYSYKKLENIRADVIYCMAEIIKKKAPNYTDTLHYNFINKLFRERSRSNENTAFINLNYDLLLDNALIYLFNRLNKNNIDYDIDYKIDFRNSKPYEEYSNLTVNENEEYWHTPRPDRAIFLLKPHGSLNWIYCPNCQTIKITPRRKSASTIIDTPTRCEIDQSIQQPIIIAPTWYKNYSNPYIVNLWMKTAEILRKSNEVVFVGYSLPEADHELRYLFKKNLYKESRMLRPKIYLVTKSRKIEEVEKRYKTLFGKDVKINNDGFETMVEKPNLNDIDFA